METLDTFLFSKCVHFTGGIAGQRITAHLIPTHLSLPQQLSFGLKIFCRFKYVTDKTFKRRVGLCFFRIKLLKVTVL